MRKTMMIVFFGGLLCCSTARAAEDFPVLVSKDELQSLKAQMEAAKGRLDEAKGRFDEAKGKWERAQQAAQWHGRLEGLLRSALWFYRINRERDLLQPVACDAAEIKTQAPPPDPRPGARGDRPGVPYLSQDCRFELKPGMQSHRSCVVHLTAFLNPSPYYQDVYLLGCR